MIEKGQYKYIVASDLDGTLLADLTSVSKENEDIAALFMRQSTEPKRERTSFTASDISFSDAESAFIAKAEHFSASAIASL